MRLVICESFLSVRDVMCIAEGSSGSFLIATTNRKLFSFLLTIYPNDNLYFMRTPSYSHPLRILLNYWDVRRYLKLLWDEVYSYKGVDVFLCEGSPSSYVANVVKKISRNNTIYFKPSVSIDGFISDRSVLSLSMFIVNVIIFNVHLTPTKYCGRRRPTIGNNYLNSIMAVKYDEFCDIDMVKSKLTSVYDIENRSVLILCGGVCDVFCDYKEYVSKTDEMIARVIKKYGVNDVYIKVHPSFNDYISSENDIDRIPGNIPIDILINNFKIVIGYTSAVLFNAANQGVVAVSLLDYIKPIDRKVADDFKSYLKNNTSKEILYPKNINELMKSVLV